MSNPFFVVSIVLFVFTITLHLSLCDPQPPSGVHKNTGTTNKGIPHSTHSVNDYTSGIESAHVKALILKAKRLLQDSQCEHVYLDVGSNIGIQVRKLYEPEFYPLAAVADKFNSFFGADVEARRKSVCTFGVEANPSWDQRLHDLESYYTKKGYPVMFFTSTAAYTSGKNLSFYMEPNVRRDVHQWGASVANWHDGMREVQVGSLPLAYFINHEIKHRPGKKYVNNTSTSTSKVLMKLDIEGAEYVVFPELMVTGAICQLDMIMAEFHAFGDPPNNIQRYHADLNYILRKTVNCKTVIIEEDDESYSAGEDPHPLSRKHRALQENSSAQIRNFRFFPTVTNRTVPDLRKSFHHLFE